MLLGLRRYRQRKAMDDRMALTLAASAVVFTFPFALLATHMSSSTLRAAFACFLFALGLFLAWRLLYQSGKQQSNPKLPLHWAGPAWLAPWEAAGRVCSVWAAQ